MHESVLLNEVIDLLNIKPNGRYVDGTLGLGGHAEAVLKRLGSRGRLLGLDVDPKALELAKNRLQPFEDQTITRRVNFRGLQGVLRELEWDQVDGMIFDLGISSLQLSDEERGLSFQQAAPLDMRLDPSLGQSALTVLRRIDQKRLEETLVQFGEGRHARKLSRYLLADIGAGKISTTADLAGFCERVLGRHGKTHPATRVFLALRNLVNDELGALQDLLDQSPRILAVGGRLLIISFHSLEDRLVKHRFAALFKDGLENMKYALVTKKPITPSLEEQSKNPRSRSAKLRVLERTE